MNEIYVSDLTFRFEIFSAIVPCEFRFVAVFVHVSVILGCSIKFGLVIAFVSSVLFLSGAFRDSSTNKEPYFTFNSACSERMLIRYCSSYTSSVVASSTGFLLKKSVNFKLLPAMCCIAISKCASRSNHLVSLALYCRLHRFLLINDSNAWWSVYKKFFFPYKQNRNFSKPHTTANNSNSPIE